jgi:hypothetical protein
MSLMDGSPSDLEEEVLDELGIRFVGKEETSPDCRSA